MISEIKTLTEIIKNFNNYQQTTLPLCAAENIMSDFCKLPLSSTFQERYIMGSAYDYTLDDNFIGSEYLLPFYTKISEFCHNLFHAKYADARTLTGMNCLGMLAMALTKHGDNIMILGKDWGGHASVKPTLERLGLNIYEAPFILNEYDFDYALLNRQVKEKNIKFLLFAPSDILFEMNLEKIDDSEVTVLYDGSQLLGLIAAGIIKNPLDSLKNCILFGGTHKTMPGPAHGLILTNNDELYSIIDKDINPKYLRNTQMHQVVSLLFTLLEMKYFGEEYQKNTVRIGNVLGDALQTCGFNVVKRGNTYTQTHQIFIECSKDIMNTIFKNACKEHVTLNTKKKPLFHGGYGIRLGLQEISRYNWDDTSMNNVALILNHLAKSTYDEKMIQELLMKLPKKKIHYTFEEKDYKDLIEIL